MTDLSSPRRPAPAGLRAGSRSALDAAIEAFIRLILGVLVTTLAATFLHPRIATLEATLLGLVLAAAAAFGLLAGLLAAAIAQIAYQLVLGGWLPPLDPRAPETLLLAVFGVTVTVVGMYADAAQHVRRRAPSPQSGDAAAFTDAAAGAAQRLFRLAWPRRSALGREPVRIEAWRALATLAVATAGVAAALALEMLIGPTNTALVALAGALLVAEQTGPRLGVTAGALTAILLTGALAAPDGEAGGLRQAVQIVLVGAFGWRVGALGLELRHERAARRVLASATRDLFGSADETAVRRRLLESLQRIDARATFEIRDEGGELLTNRKRHSTARSRRDGAGWRSRGLEADGRNVGEVRWRSRDAQSGGWLADEVAGSVIDLGASAIVRARLTKEKADVEYFAHAEQFRMLMLDAASHHFRTPLAGILGSVTSILNLPERHDRRVHQDFLLIIKEQANRLSRYIDNFQSLARLESDVIDVNLTDVDIETLIYDVWESFGASGGARRYLQADMEVSVARSDRALLTQIFENILENSIKYSSEESLVEVRAHRQEDKLVIQVLDEGPGVPDESLERMFDRFYRSHTAKAPGLGLGLYISRSLVEMLGGVLSAHNRSDGRSGLVVSISLPLAEGDL